MGRANLVTGSKPKLDEELGRAFVERRQNLRDIASRAGRAGADEVVQDAFLEIVAYSKGREIRKVDNLLSRIVRSVALRRIRDRKKKSGLLWSEAGENLVDLAADPERSLIGVQRLQRVMAAIDVMPAKRREVFLLHRVEEMTFPQIARRLGVSVKTVEKHMHLAMLQLSDTDD